MPDWTNLPDDPDRHLIVISAPRRRHPKYWRHFDAIIDFDIRLAQAIIGHDNVIVLARREEMAFLRGKLPDDVLLEANLKDIWIRDFAPILTTRMVQFVYRPSYLSWGEAAEASESFASFCRRYRLQFERSRLILDGGNLVSNHKDMAVVTERVLSDNPDWTRDEIIAELKEKLALKHIAIIPEEPGDKTGHADGIVMWATDAVLAVNDFAAPFNILVTSALESGLPGVTLIPVSRGDAPLPSSTKSRFLSACGLNVNAVVAEKTIYVPVFDGEADEAFLKAVARCTDKVIRSVQADEVCGLGGSARCLSLQVIGENGRTLLQAARQT